MSQCGYKFKLLNRSVALSSSVTSGASLAHNFDLLSVGGRQEQRFEQSLATAFNDRNA